MKKTLCLALILCLLLAALPAAAMAYDVVLSPQKLTVDGQYVDCEKYNIDGSNYFKLRDLAFLLMGTNAEFGVGYDPEANSVTVTPGMPYEPVGGELTVGEDKSATAVPSEQTIWFMGFPVKGLSIYNIGGNNFFKLRDLGQALNFAVDYDETTNTAIVRTAAARSAAYDDIWSWTQENANGDPDGETEYTQHMEWDDGDSADYELIAMEIDGDKSLSVLCTYYYDDGASDRTWVFLDAGAEGYFVSYVFYDVGNDDPLAADFAGSLALDPAAYVGYEPVTFISVDGPQAADEADFSRMASEGIRDAMVWLDLLIHDTEALSTHCVLDFGFTDELFAEKPEA